MRARACAMIWLVGWTWGAVDYHEQEGERWSILVFCFRHGSCFLFSFRLAEVVD